MSNNETQEEHNYDERQYSFEKPLRRLRFKKQLPSAFDEKKYTHKNNSYFGKIQGIRVKITHKSNSKYTISVENEEGLKRIHHTALQRILDYERDNPEDDPI